jgi:hypothetical protein
MSDRPYVAAFKAVQELSDLPTAALAELRHVVLDLGMVSEDQPDVARACVLVAVLLRDLVESDGRVREESRDCAHVFAMHVDGGRTCTRCGALRCGKP